MDSNFQNTTPLAARPEDPEKALLTPPHPPSYYAVYQTAGAEEVLPQDRRRIVRRRRLCHFAACTLLLFLFWSPLVDSVASVFYKVRVHINFDSRPNTVAHPCPCPQHFHKDVSVDPHWAHEIMASPSDCADTVNWRLDPVQDHSDWPYHAHASLALPIDAEELFFKAEGSRAHGTFEVSQSTDVGTEAIVDIDVAYRRENALAETTVCHLNPSENKHGLGIFVSATGFSCPCAAVDVGAIDRLSAGTTPSITASSASTSTSASRRRGTATRARSTRSTPTCRCSRTTSLSSRTRSSSRTSASRRRMPRSGPMYVPCLL